MPVSNPFPSVSALVRTLHVFGDSYVNGAGATLGTSDFGTVLGHLLGATTITVDGVNGAQAADDGINHILQTFTPGRTAAPYLPATQVFVIKYGTNDISNGVGANVYKQAVRSMVARARASRIIEDTDGAWAGFGGSAASASVNCNSGAGVSYTFGGPVTLTVPADFEGGTVTVHTIASDAADATTQISWTVDGGPAVIQSGYTVHKATRYNSFAQRFTGLSAGAHTIVGTVGGTNSVYFDFASIEADPPPLVVLPLTPVLPGGPAAATVATYNQALSEIAGEFGDHVITVDLHSLFTDHPGYVFTDNTHPNERGHRIGFAAALARAVTTAMTPELAAGAA